MDLVEIGVTAGGESAQQVERARGLEVAGLHAGGIGDAVAGGEGGAVDDVAAVGREGPAVDRFGVGGARLGELAGHAAELHHGKTGAEGQDDGHLQQHAEGVADDVGGEFAEAFGAGAALEHEGAAFGGGGQMGLQAAGFAGEDQRRIGAQAGFGRLEGRVVGVGGDLADRVAAPGVGRPGRCGVGPVVRAHGSGSGVLALGPGVVRPNRGGGKVGLGEGQGSALDSPRGGRPVDPPD